MPDFKYRGILVIRVYRTSALLCVIGSWKLNERGNRLRIVDLANTMFEANSFEDNGGFPAKPICFPSTIEKRRNDCWQTRLIGYQQSQTDYRSNPTNGFDFYVYFEKLHLCPCSFSHLRIIKLFY